MKCSNCGQYVYNSRGCKNPKNLNLQSYKNKVKKEKNEIGATSTFESINPALTIKANES